METGKDPRVQIAIQFAKVGEKERARQLLIELLRQNRNDFDAWVVMAQVAGNREEAISCMKQAIRLRPNDEKARRALEYLLQGEPAGRAPIGTIQGGRTGSVPTGSTQDAQTNSPPPNIAPWIRGGLGVGLIVGLLIAAIFIVPRLTSQAPPGDITQMALNLPIGGATQTSDAQPTVTPSHIPEATSSPDTSPTATTPPPTATTPPPTSTVSPTATTPPPTETTPPPTETTEAPPSATMDPSTNPCDAFTFGGITVNPDQKAISITISHPGGATLTDIMIAWSMEGSLDSIKHNAEAIPDTSASTPRTFSVSESIGTGDVLEFWFSVENIPSTGYTIILTFAGGCTQPLISESG